jgi:DNA-binding IclR family transcriptional regulator
MKKRAFIPPCGSEVTGYMVSKSTERSSVKSLDKSLLVLEILANTSGEIDLSTLTKQTRIPKSTLLRLLNTLKSHNFVLQNPRSRQFQLGWALIYLGKAAEKSFDLINVVHPLLEDLASRTGETASLVLIDGDHAVYVDQVVSSSIIRGHPPIGTPLHLHCSASGKVLLSAFTSEELASFLGRTTLVKKTEKTITDPVMLQREIKRIQEVGFAFDDEETEIGGRCVAAPVCDREGRIVASISVVGPSTRIARKELVSLAELVRRDADRASSTLGYRT